MRKIIFVLAMFCLSLAGAATAEVLVLKDSQYIDNITIVEQDEATVRFVHGDGEYVISADKVASVAETVPAEYAAVAPEAVAEQAEALPEPEEEEEWEEEAQESESMVEDPVDSEAEPMDAMDVTDENAVPEEVLVDSGRRYSMTLGFLNGGGSLIGVDFQVLLGDSNIALQFGAGFIGADVGVNYYFEPHMDSEYVSLTFWHQGITDPYIEYIGATYGFKAFGWLNGQIGIGYILNSEGVEMVFPAGYDKLPIVALYSIGAYF